MLTVPSGATDQPGFVAISQRTRAGRRSTVEPAELGVLGGLEVAPAASAASSVATTAASVARICASVNGAGPLPAAAGGCRRRGRRRRTAEEQAVADLDEGDRPWDLEHCRPAEALDVEGAGPIEVVNRA